MKMSETWIRTSTVSRTLLLSASCAALWISALSIPATAAAQDHVGHPTASPNPAPPPAPKTLPANRRPSEPELRPLSELPASELENLEAMLAAEVQDVVDRQVRIPGQGQGIKVRVRYNRATDDVDIDLGRAYLPRGAIAVTEDLSEGLREVTNTVHDLLDGIFSYRFTNEQFDGKAIDDFFE